MGPVSEAPPLKGLKVLEVSRSPAAGFCGRQLHLWGAQVTLVEPPGYQGLRGFGQRARPDGQVVSPSFDYLSAGKALSSPGSSAELLAVLETADAVISDIHPHDEAAVFGLSLEALRRLCPGLVIVSISPFGREAGSSEKDVTSLQLQALSGYLSMNGKADEPPIAAPGHLVDHIIGANALVGGLAALLRARRIGQGDLVEVSGLETVAGLLPYLKEQFAEAPTVRVGGTPEGVRLLPCQDGWVALLLSEPTYVAIYAEALGIDPHDLPQNLYSCEPQEALEAREAYFAVHCQTRTRKQLFDAIQARGVVCGPVNRLAEVQQDPHLATRGFFERVEGGNCDQPPLAGLPARINRSAVAGAAPSISPVSDAPLSGIKVLDLTQAWMGPLAGQILADLGAEVTKIENPSRPDIWRLMGQQPALPNDLVTEAHDRSIYFQAVNRNKNSLTLDLRDPADCQTFRSLALSADVVLENFTPQVMARFGLGFEVLNKLNPALVMTAFSGYGASGPLAPHKANGTSIEAMAGWDSLHLDNSGNPVLMGGYPADPACALQMAACTLVALLARQADGRGAHVEGSMLEAAAAYIGDELLASALGLGPAPSLEAIVRAADDDCWDILTPAPHPSDNAVVSTRIKSLSGVLGDPGPWLSAWFVELDDPGLGRRLFNGRFWRFQSARLPPPEPAPRLAQHCPPA